MNNPIKIKTSYWGLSITTLAAVLLVGMFVWSLFLREPLASRGPVFIIVASLIILMFGFYALFGIHQLIHSKPALIIDDSGITDNFAGLHSLYLRWDEIDSMKLFHFGFRTYLSIKPKTEVKKIADLPLISRIKFYLDLMNFFSRYTLKLEHYDFHEIGKSKDFYALLESFRKVASQ